MNQPPVQRIRIYFAKQNALRYTSNLDMHRIWERSFRRARLPLAYSQGFHPQPRINQACPLPLGMTSQNDMVDIWLEEECALDQIAQTLRLAVPTGLEIDSIQSIDLHAPSLPIQVVSAQYHVTPLDDVDLDSLRSAITNLLDASEIKRTRREKSYNLRPLIEQLWLETPVTKPITICIQLSTREGATGRPEEVLSELGIDPLHARMVRTRLILSD